MSEDSPPAPRRQIDSATDLQSVVRTMKALAASNIGQYERSVRALTGYDRARGSWARRPCLRHAPLPSGDARRGRGQASSGRSCSVPTRGWSGVSTMGSRPCSARLGARPLPGGPGRSGRWASGCTPG